MSGESPASDRSRPIDRREFVRIAGAGGIGLAASALPRFGHATTGPALSARTVPDVVVIGAGAFGLWTAFHLQRDGHQVTLVDLYGPGNSRATSGDETRGIRTGYGENVLWSSWAKEAIERWKAWDETWGTRIFTTTGDVCMRAEWSGFLEQCATTWDRVGVRYERISVEEAAYRFPQMRFDGFEVGVYEPDAGVARARIAVLTLADRFRALGGEVVIAGASPGRRAGGRMTDVALSTGESLTADAFVFALGPWFPKAMPELMSEMIRIPMGHVYYFGTPPGDPRFNSSNCPSWNFPGVTGWPTLEHDHRGFRVRTGGRQGDDPDTSVRWIDESYHEQARRILRERFPDLADAPLLETRSCHYEISATNNFIVDRYPGLENVWLAGGGSAEGFKFGPVLGPYIAGRVTGAADDPELARTFSMDPGS